jgi:predicted aspartyl protease
LVSVRGLRKKEWAYLDTGYDGYLVIPASAISEFGPHDYLSRWELGDGNLVIAQEYLGEIELVGLEHRMPARITCLGEEWILGRSVLDRLMVVFDRGEKIQVEI